MKSASTIKCINTSIIYSQEGNVEYAKALAHNTSFLLQEKIPKMFGQRGISAAILTDMLKAFDSIFTTF